MTIFESTRQLLSQGDTAQALRLLISHLEKGNNAPEALRILRVLEANFSRAKEKELKGILDFSEAQQAYSKTNDALLSVIDDLAGGRKPSLALENTGARDPRIYWLLGVAILILLGLIAGILLRNESPGGKGAKVAACPKFNKEGVPILLIPFQNLGDTESKPELAIQTRIRDLTERNNMTSDVQIYSGDQFLKSTPGKTEATEVGNDCNAAMVIWGQFEKVEAGISLDVRYIFADKPNLPTGKISETLRNLSELSAENARFNSLEDAIFSLCAAIAYHEGRTELVEKWLGKMQTPSARDIKLREMLQK